MKKRALIIIFAFCLCISFSWSQGRRKAVWAGKFYEENAEILSRQIDSFLQNVKKEPLSTQNIIALIAPHAGYFYSGQVAAAVYRLVQGKDYETVIIIAPSHRYGFRGCSIYLQGGYETPLGTVNIDESLASKLSKASGFKYVPQAHAEEHSVEVQIPFIQKTLPSAKIVPIVMGFQTKETIISLANALIEVLKGEKILVVASTDMSHQLPKKRANDIDSKTTSLIQSFEINLLIRKIEKGENIMCGGGPVTSTLLYAQKKKKPEITILHYADSSLVGGPESGVVGYLAAAIHSRTSASEFRLSAEEKKELLRLARSSITQFIQEEKVLNYETQSSILLSKKGAFVTLKKEGQLRGCIGYIEPALPLYQTIIRASIFAACRDPRFPPVSVDELEELEIEISVLTPLKKIQTPRLVEVGKHGLVISKGNKKGLLLPQVPVENHWSRETFLQQACLKAGLPENAWKTGADIFIFEAVVFQ